MHPDFERRAADVPDDLPGSVRADRRHRPRPTGPWDTDPALLADCRDAQRRAEHALDTAVQAAVSDYYWSQSRHPGLEPAVCALVDALRTRGSDVVTVIRAVRARVDTPPQAAGRTCPCWVRENAVRWSIAHFFAESPIALPPPADA